MTPALAIDIAIIGGGIAGLWLLSRLRAKGYGVLLIESHRFGSGQTILSQGIIHGGTKYALHGEVSESAKTIGAMPGIWRRCLAGEGEVDLSRACLLARHQYLWATSSLGSRFTAFFASKIMHSRLERVSEERDYPPALRHKLFHGKVYRLDEPVLDVASLIQALTEPHREALVHSEGPAVLNPDGTVTVQAAEREPLVVRPRRVLFAAGIGNASLPWAPAQIRPLHMVMIRGEHLPSGLYAHCLGTGDVPRVTITSHRDLHYRNVWYVGGQLAEEGVTRGVNEQICAARQELGKLLPWVDLSDAQFSTLHARRIEAQQRDGKRPATPSVIRSGPVIAVWPTKLALAPMLADTVQALLVQDKLQPRPVDLSRLQDWPRPQTAHYPWNEEHRKWY